MSPTCSRSRQKVHPLKYVLFYESADDVASKAPAHYADHSARAQEFHSRGVLLSIGVFADAQNEGAMAVFTSREAAEEFAKEDPFVINGVVRDWRVCEWMEVLGAN
ncbi:MAG: uncharacterized protein QOE54_343 [Streptosporangiaceae bacterium]|jgi:uncharacterized protein YciI|nr:uncharacterized protein [Streptosporangiaceae bacterium]